MELASVNKVEFASRLQDRIHAVRTTADALICVSYLRVESRSNVRVHRGCNLTMTTQRVTFLALQPQSSAVISTIPDAFQSAGTATVTGTV